MGLLYIYRNYFIPIRNNLDFDFRFMEYKLNLYFGMAAFEFSSPKVDLFIILCNDE
jgi:hypothetical protein